LPNTVAANIQTAITTRKIRAIKGIELESDPKEKIRPVRKNDPPDFPSLEPTPSIADFPRCLHSSDKGTNASSFVASKSVYFEALLKQFCIEPKKTLSIKGELPKMAAIAERLRSSHRRKAKKAKPETKMTTGVINALNLQPHRLITPPEIKIEVIVATDPITVIT